MRRSWSVALLAAALALGAQPSRAEPLPRLEIRGERACLDPTHLSDALKRRRLPQQHLGRLLLQVAQGDKLVVTLTDRAGDLVGQRDLEVSDGECQELPHALALLVEAWLAAPPRAPLPQPAPLPIRPPDPPPRAPSPPEPEPEPGIQIGVSLFGGGYLLGDGRSLGYQGGAAIAWRRGSRWGAALQINADSPVSGSAGPGSAEARAQALDLCAEVRFHPAASGTLNVLLGGFGQRLAASSQGYSRNVAATLHDFGLAALAQWEQRLGWGLFAVGGLRVGVRLHRDRFAVHGPDGDWNPLEVSALRLSASLGLGWQLL